MGPYVGQESQEKEMDNTMDEDAEGWGKGNMPGGTF